MAEAPVDPLLTPMPAVGWPAVQAESVDSRGRRLVAESACRRGDVLLRETPLLLWGPDARAHAQGLAPRLSSAPAELEDLPGGWDALAAWLCFSRLTTELQDAVRSQREGLNVEAAAAISEDEVMVAMAMMPEVAEVLGSGAHSGDFLLVAKLVAANATENSDSRRALYGGLSLANHACAPNAAWRTVQPSTGEKELVCIARSVAKGEELCISYLPERELFLGGCDERRRRLREARCFDCGCDRCAAFLRDGESKGEQELLQLGTELLEGSSLRAMPQDREAAMEQCKSLGRQLRRLDALWPAASALKASLWTSFTELLAACGAPEALASGAAQRALEESKPCLGARQWTDQARHLEKQLAALAALRGGARKQEPADQAPLLQPVT